MELPLEIWAKIATILRDGGVYNLILRSVPVAGRASLANPNWCETRYILRELFCRAIVPVPDSIPPLSDLFINARAVNFWLISDGAAMLRYST